MVTVEMLPAVEPVAPPLSEARGITHEFPQPGGHTLRVLEDVSIAIPPGVVVALLGPSGCGKSTLLRILAGLTRPTRGEVLSHGEPMRGLNPGIAIVFQSFALYPWMTVSENIRAVLDARGVTAEAAEARVEAVVNLVGLSGFEGAYPRELSGGMKQRVGMARALSVQPELLFMDEPFSQVDALTAESLRAEVLDIWSHAHSNPSSLLMVSHDIKEVAYMADRIVVMGTNPGRVRTVVHNGLARPRDYRSPELLRLVDQLHEIITGHEMPDVAAAAPVQAVRPMEPLPEVLPGEIEGLLEYLDARGESEELFRIATDAHQEFGHLITVVKAVEMLSWVDTPGRTVKLTPAGREYLKASETERRAMWKKQLLELRLFQRLVEVMRAQPGQRLDRDVVLEILALALPAENHERLFETLVRWARAGELMNYDPASERLALEE